MRYESTCRAAWAGFWLVAGSCLAAAGCGERAGTPAAAPSIEREPGGPVPPANEPTFSAQPAEEPTGKNDRQFWQILMLGGNRVGYASTTIRHITQDGQALVQIDGQSVLRVQRFNQTTEQQIRFTDVQTPEGKLVRLNASVEQGSEPHTTVGVVRGDRLELEIGTLGKTMKHTIPWSADCGGFHAVEDSLSRRPMQPGEQRRLKVLMPGMTDLAEVELTAVEHEQTTLPGGQFNLLRIDSVTHLGPGQELRSVVWTDPDGEALKSWTDTLNLETYRVPRDVALADVAPSPLDLGFDLAVKVKKSIANPHATKRVQYRVTLADDDPAEAFPQGSSQRVVAVGPHVAEITVYALRPGAEGNPNAPAETPAEADLRPSNMIQSDAPEIVRLAGEAVGEEKDPWRKAVALERFVGEYVTQKDYSQAFATAAEVAREREGDCTEHAVLLAGLCRAAGIPARVAAGLVYLPHRRAMFFHMWTEAYVDGRYIPLDATVAQGGIGAAHLKLVNTSMEGSTAFTAFLPIIRVIGRLSIEVLEVE